MFPTPTLNIIESTPLWGITFGLILEREKVRNDVTFFGNRNRLCSIISRVFFYGGQENVKETWTLDFPPG